MEVDNTLEQQKIGTRIRKLRESKDYSQHYIANALGMSISGYSRIERDEVKVTLDKLFVICQLLEVKIEHIVMGDYTQVKQKANYNNPNTYSKSISNYKSIEDIYKDQINSLKEEVKYLREILYKLT